MLYELFKKSWVDLKNNLVIFVPDVLNFIILAILFLVFIFASGVYAFLSTYKSIPLAISSIGTEAIFADLFAKFLIWIVVFLVAAFLISNYFIAMKLGMINEVAEKKKTALAKGFGYASKNYLNVLGFNLLTLLLIFIPTMALVSLVLLSNWLVPLALVLLTIYFLILVLGIQFIYPVMFMDKKGPVSALKGSFGYLKKKLGLVVKVLLIVLLVGIVASAIGSFIGFFSIVLSWIVSVWANMFRFNVYNKAR